MFEHFTRYPWVLPIHHYPDLQGLLTSLKEEVIEPAEKKAKELREALTKSQCIWRGAVYLNRALYFMKLYHRICSNQLTVMTNIQDTFLPRIS